MKEYEKELFIRSRCPLCQKSITWLRPSTVEIVDTDPSFFICFECKFIGQIGIGEVKATE